MKDPIMSRVRKLVTDDPRMRAQVKTKYAKIGKPAASQFMVAKKLRTQKGIRPGGFKVRGNPGV